MINNVTITKKVIPVTYGKKKEPMPWVRIEKHNNGGNPLRPKMLLPEQPQGYIKARRHDFL